MRTIKQVGLIFALVLSWSMAAAADTYRAVPVTLPDGKSTLAVLDTKTGRVWLLTCLKNCSEPLVDDPKWAGKARLLGRNVLEPVWYLHKREPASDGGNLPFIGLTPPPQ